MKIISLFLFSLLLLSDSLAGCQDVEDARLIVQGSDGKEFVNIPVGSLVREVGQFSTEEIQDLVNMGSKAAASFGKNSEKARRDSLEAVSFLKQYGHLSDREIRLLDAQQNPEYLEYIQKASILANEMTLEDLQHLDVEKVAHATGAVEPVKAIIYMVKDRAEEIARNIDLRPRK